MAKAVDYVSLKPTDFLADADFLVWGADLRGAYCSIIFALYANKGSISCDPEHIRQVANWRGNGWDKAWNVLRRKFSETETLLRHKRVTFELRRARRHMKARSQAGLAGAKARWQTHSKGNAIAMPSKVKGSKGKEGKNPLPPSLDTPEFREAWQEWETHRREIRKRQTPTSRKRQLASCEKMGVARAIAMIENTIEKGWMGLREPDSKPNIAPGDFRDADATPIEA